MQIETSAGAVVLESHPQARDLLRDPDLVALSKTYPELILILEELQFYRNEDAAE